MAVDIVWFRRDLRLADNPAWSAGTHQEQVCPLFVVDPRLFPRVSSLRQAALVAALNSLDDRLGAGGGMLRVEVGDPVDVVPGVAAEIDARHIHINREVTPYGQRRDSAVGRQVTMVAHDGVYLHPPGSVRTGSGDAYRVFTAFFGAWSQRRPASIASPGTAAIGTTPGIGIPQAAPSPVLVGEDAARRRLAGFLDRVDAYGLERDRADIDSTSRLSIDLKYGTLSPLTAYRAVGTATEGRRAFVRQLAWRDFFGQLMAEWPDTVDRPMRSGMDTIRWREDPEGLAAWKGGMTGYPIVDAGMRQLATEGWIHNRVRMLVASFLVKDLLIDWRIGERFLRRHLLDGDVAQNVGNWQWVAGTGADAAPYFRVFNPVLQSTKFDPEGRYIARWIPELASLAPGLRHAPWEAAPLELASAGVTLGETYPWPMVDHATARRRALDVYGAARADP